MKSNIIILINNLFILLFIKQKIKQVKNMKTIIEAFEKTTKKHYEKVGFIDSSRQSTFSETMENAKSIATSLLVQGKQKAVAIMIEKSCNCIDAMLGALYAGDFYTVIDIKSPVDRIQSILETLKDPLIITDANSIDLANRFETKYTLFQYEDIVKTEINELGLQSIRAEIIDLDIAYILFTSGSTGTPKGTVVNHRSLISYINWVTDEFRFDEKTVFGSQTPLYFSMSVTDFYSTIKCGCTYNIIPKTLFSFPINMVKYLNENMINTIYWVPTALSILSNWKVFDVEKPEHLKTVLFAGEVMPTKQLNYWINSLNEVKFANLFGPTEATDICTFYVVDREFEDTESIPIGKHCDNCNVFILKDDGKEANIGEEGELYIRSSFVASGYYDNPEKTKEAFVQNPLNSHYPEIVYKTGDLVKMRENGEILYISRIDFQIKRSGYRIELGEIEAAANVLKNIKGCACVYDKNSEKIILYYEGRKTEKDAVFNQVKNSVPTYMVPDEVLRIKELPKNANGKIDRKELLSLYKQNN